jgi:hypothetical protein
MQQRHGKQLLLTVLRLMTTFVKKRYIVEDSLAAQTLVT